MKKQTDNHFSTIVNVKVSTVFQRWSFDVVSTLKYGCTMLWPIFNHISTLGSGGYQETIW